MKRVLKRRGCVGGRVAVLVLIFAPVAHGTGRITPGLNPESDTKFFKKDYPDDARPAALDHFDHPFPTVQDSGDFDKDFVKDENNDNGEWAAQERYDSLRTKLSKEKMDLQKAIEQEQRREADLQDVIERERAAEEAAKDAEDKTEDAAKVLDDATGAAVQAKDAVGDGTGRAEKEIKDLADCQKQLQEAKDRLAELLAEEQSATHEDEDVTATDSETKKAEAESEAEAAAAEKEKDEKEKSVAEQAEEHEEALKSYKEEVAEADATEMELEKAAKQLRKYRKNLDNGSDHNGGVYSAASHHAMGLAVVSLAAVAVLGPLGY